ncbi:2OG-Fe dioxygenase family protein [Streptomyces sp. HPF1205]|uniref:2OG-Fe dioxygenase family protein n=1 Tax=Streptomyces sp. HPF1205 TaxID=2873262 RepID=UPI001CECD6D3|nr:2OG-Fe dioxygenase family protein [Streptomyces sp. HPF1205]
MTTTGTSRTFRAAAPAAAREALTREGAYEMGAGTVRKWVGADRAGAWERFARHWEDLVPDAYAAAAGTRRLRRYGHFLLDRNGEITASTHEVFRQPQDTNPLYVDVERHFEPLTDAFAADPVPAALLRLLANVASCLDDTDGWSAKVHPFRVVAAPGQAGEPAPEGRHRDGVTLVSTLLVGRRNADGGESAVFRPDGEPLLTTTLRTPGALLLGDDRRTRHDVTPVRPADPSAGPARRDVLVVTLTAR